MSQTQHRPATLRVAANCRAEIARQGMTRGQFGALMGWSQSKTSAMLRGNQRWDIDTVEDAARALGVEPAALSAEAVA